MIDKKHVNEILKAIQEGCVFNPLRVNTTTNNLLDGQHRRAAFMFAVEKGIIPNNSTLSVQYDTIPEEAEMGMVWGLNCNSKNWSMDDFIMSHSTYNESYIKLIDFCKNHVLYHPNEKKQNQTTGNIKYKSRAAANLLKGGVSQQNNLKNGTFNLDDVDFEAVEVVYNEIETFLNILNFRPTADVLESLQKSWLDNRVEYDFSFPLWLKGFNHTHVKSKFQEMRPTKKKDWDDFFEKVAGFLSKKSIR